ncbi:hypothetical protein [Chromatium okenii]|nr:hypothetical protein [Chromatium okenii]
MKAARSNSPASGACQEPYDYIPQRSYPLFLAREALQAVITDIHHRALHR